MSSIYSTTRITGLSSGLDTDSLVKAALAQSQSQLDRLYQNKTTLEWQRDAYTDVRTKASEFSNKYFSQLSSDNIFSKNAYKQFKVSVNDKYNSYFSIKGTASAQAGNHTITSMTKATAATVSTKSGVTGKTVSIDGAGNTNTSKKAVTENKLYWKTKDENGNDKYVALDATNASQAKLDEIYTDSTGSNKAFAVKSDGSLSTLTVKNSSAKNASSKDVDYNKDTTFQELMNSLDGAGVKVSFGTDNNAGKIEFTSDVVGADSTVSISGADGLALSKETENVSAITKDTKLSDLKDMAGKNIFDSDGKAVFKINGESFTISDSDDTTIGALIQQINANEDAAVTMSLDDKTGVFRIQGKDGGPVNIENVSGKFFGDKNLTEDSESLTGLRVQNATDPATIDRTKDTIASAAQKMGVSDSIQKGVLKFTINGTTVEFDADTTLDKMMAEINSNEKLGVKMSYSQITDQFTIASTETGRLSSIKIGNVEGGADALAFFGVNKDEDTQEYLTEAYGTDAKITIDDVEITRSSNTFTLDGMEITIKENWTSEMEGEDGNKLGTARISVEQDIDSTVEKMKNFVNAYNELVDSLYSLTSEQKDYDYEPLTEDQKDLMEKEDIEKWEAEAKKGILRNDTTLRTYLSRMRSAIFEKVGGTNFSNITGSDKDREGMSAYDIGFNTVGYEYGSYGGKIVFDEEKFRAAMAKDPDAVANVMAQVSDATDDTTNYSESGFATKLFDITSDFINTLRGTNIQNTNKKITSVNNSMDTLIEKMQQQQERLYQQYAQLETLMTTYQNQSTWLSNQLAGLTTT